MAKSNAAKVQPKTLPPTLEELQERQARKQAAYEEQLKKLEAEHQAQMEREQAEWLESVREYGMPEKDHRKVRRLLEKYDYQCIVAEMERIIKSWEDVEIPDNFLDDERRGAE